MKNLLMLRTAIHHGRTAKLLAAAMLSFGCGATSPGSALQAASTSAQTGPSLGSAGNFAALAGSAVTCTDSVVTGDVGVWPGTAITRTNCTITGAIHPGDAAAHVAQLDFQSAYNAFALLPCGTTLPSGNLAGLVLGPGVYCVDAASTTTGGTLTLAGPPDGMWVFKIGTKGTGALTGTNFSVVTSAGTPPPCNNVFWWVAEAATMTDSKFVGTILAGAAITITRGTFNGDALALAAVTMTGATVSSCGNGAPSPNCKDFVTGGGWIRLPDGGKGTFGVSGGFKHGELSGHLTYVDHGETDNDPKASGMGMKVKGTGVTDYRVIDAFTRHIEGKAEINGQAGYTYQVEVMDAGEPGRDDTFSLKLSNGYSASGKLAGGNIKLHKKCRPLICDASDDEDDDEGEGEGDRR